MIEIKITCLQDTHDLDTVKRLSAIRDADTLQNFPQQRCKYGNGHLHPTILQRGCNLAQRIDNSREHLPA